MVILGLTGSIAMGKTEAANVFRRLGIHVHDADKVVHELMSPDGQAVGKIRVNFPEVMKGGKVDRELLGKKVFGDLEALKKLESILHPLVHNAECYFLSAAVRRDDSLVVLDIPLLFETGSDDRCDVVAVVSAPARIQRARALSRIGMTEERLSQIFMLQMSDAEKRQRAAFVIPTGVGRAHSLRVIKKIARVAKFLPALKWKPGYGFDSSI